jgi:hypothetical protein
MDTPARLAVRRAQRLRDPVQALAVFELLDDLRELICARYLPDMQRLLREDRHL